MVDLTSEHLELARWTARGFYRRLPKGLGLNLCDLESAANYGLVQASIRYQKGVGTFKEYAQIRIRGSILDLLRSLDPMSRSMRKRLQLWDEPIGKAPFRTAEEVSSLPAKEPGPEQLAIRQQEIDRIRAVTHLLSPREQLLLQMRHDDDLPLSEIAVLLRITEGRVSQLQQRTHQRLRCLLTTSQPSSRQSLVRHLKTRTH